MSAEIIHKTSDVYGISRELPINYVERKNVDNSLVDNLTRDKHLVIYGSSKQGKTSLRKHCLKEDDYIAVHCSNKWGLAELHSAILKKAGYEVTQSTTRTITGENKIVATAKGGFFGIGIETKGQAEKSDTESTVVHELELDPTDVNDIIRGLEGLNKFIILEDFHYLPIETQKDFAVALKAFHEQSKLCFIIIGVWMEDSRLTVYNGDLTGRVTGINADTWLTKELREVIEAGEYLLNIEFSEQFKQALVDNCKGNVYVAQEACYQACVKKDIYQTQGTHIIVGEDIDVVEIIKEVVSQQTARYNSFITQFAYGFQDTALQMYKWLLYPILISDVDTLEQGISYRQIRTILQAHHPEGTNLNPGNITQALQATASLQIKKDIKPIILDYDQTNLCLNVVDKSFLIWLENQNRDDLLDLADLPRGQQGG